MVDIEKLSEDDFDSIVTDALDLFKEVAENSLSFNRLAVQVVLILSSYVSR